MLSGLTSLSIPSQASGSLTAGKPRNVALARARGISPEDYLIGALGVSRLSLYSAYCNGDVSDC